MSNEELNLDYLIAAHCVRQGHGKPGGKAPVQEVLTPIPGATYQIQDPKTDSITRIRLLPEGGMEFAFSEKPGARKFSCLLVKGGHFTDLANKLVLGLNQVPGYEHPTLVQPAPGNGQDSQIVLVDVESPQYASGLAQFDALGSKARQSGSSRPRIEPASSLAAEKAASSQQWSRRADGIPPGSTGPRARQ